MSSNSSINGVSSVPSVSFLDDLHKNAQNKSQQASNSSSQETANQPQTAKEMKLAELQGKPVQIGEEQIIKAIEKANKALLGATTSFEFSIHQKTHEIMVKVIDQETGETIRELPPEKTLDMVAKMWELAGIIVDKKV